MNPFDTFDETRKNKEHLRLYRTEKYGYSGVCEVDTAKVRVRGEKWHNLSGFHKRKFENLIVLALPQEHIKVLYV
jgi:hypothetical protein